MLKFPSLTYTPCWETLRPPTPDRSFPQAPIQLAVDIAAGTSTHLLDQAESRCRFQELR